MFTARVVQKEHLRDRKEYCLIIKTDKSTREHSCKVHLVAGILEPMKIKCRIYY